MVNGGIKMKKEITLSPWHYNDDTGDVFSKNGLPVAEVSADTSKQKVNGFLIAAAPDLLEACEMAYNYLDGIGYSEYSPDIARVLRAVIDKARGE
jgi:hypothetical protein